MKNIAVFNDLSGFGKCSLTAAIPVLSVLGCSCHPVATAVLTGQSGYRYHYCKDLSDMLPEYEKNWEKNKVSLDAIYTGYLTNPSQFDVVYSFIDKFRREESFLLVDPVMGDQGNPYSIFSEELLLKMKELCQKADMITPNLTEACLLSDTDYRKLKSISDKNAMLKETVRLAGKLQDSLTNHPDVIITGILPEQKNNPYIYTIAVTKDQIVKKGFPFYEKGYSGTGDLFASVMCGLKMNHFSVEDSIEIAGSFLSHSIADTIQENIPGNDGIHFESHLGELFNSINKKEKDRLHHD